jgi:hypothetical protein
MRRSQSPRLDSYNPLTSVRGYAKTVAQKRISSGRWSPAPISGSWMIRQNAEKSTSTPKKQKESAPRKKVSIWVYIESRIEQLTRGRERNKKDQPAWVDKTAARNLLKVLRQVCNTSTVFPFISPDGDEGIAATWRAFGSAIQITCDTDGQSWLMVRHAGDVSVREVDLDSREELAEVRQRLTEFTKKLNTVNPGWRSIFLEAQ